MGKALYERACARCHGDDGKGDRPDVQLNARMPNFARCAEAAEEPDEQWRMIIEKGGIFLGLSEQMPAYGEVLTKEQIDSLLEYMRRFCPDKRWVRGELNFQRPLFTEKAFPEKEFVFSLSLRRTKAGPPNLSWSNLWERRVGPRTQIEANIPLRSVGQAIQSGTQHRSFEIGDAEIGVKQVLLDSLPARFILSAGMELVLPTGNIEKGFGSGTLKFEPFVAAGKEIRGWVLQTSAKFEIPADSDTSEREVVYNLAIGYPVYRIGGIRDLFPMLELVMSREIKSGVRASLFLVPQLRFPIDRMGRWAVSAGPLLPINPRISARAGFAAYLLYEYGDR